MKPIANWKPTAPAQVTLAQGAPGQSVRLERLGEEVELDGEILRYLDDRGFIPGPTATVTAKGPDGTLMLEVGGMTLALDSDLCQRLYVVAV